MGEKLGTQDFSRLKKGDCKPNPGGDLKLKKEIQ